VAVPVARRTYLKVREGGRVVSVAAIIAVGGRHRGPARDRRPGPRPLGGGAVLVGLPQGPAQARPARRQAGGLGRARGPQARHREGARRHVAALPGALDEERARARAQGPADGGRRRAPPGLPAADQATARQVWRQVADQLRPRWPRLAALMDESEHDVLAYMAFPASTGPSCTARTRSSASTRR
jgi:hypothetical protein